MKLKVLSLTFVVACLSLAALPTLAQDKADPLSGTWAGDWGPSAADRNQVTVELHWDGKALTGSVNPGANAVELQKCTFDAKTGAVHMEAEAKNRRGAMVHYTIDGKVEGGSMTGSWNHDNRAGDFKITKK